MPNSDPRMGPDAQLRGWTRAWDLVPNSVAGPINGTGAKPHRCVDGAWCSCSTGSTGSPEQVLDPVPNFVTRRWGLVPNCVAVPANRTLCPIPTRGWALVPNCAAGPAGRTWCHIPTRRWGLMPNSVAGPAGQVNFNRSRCSLAHFPSSKLARATPSSRNQLHRTWCPTPRVGR